MSNEIPFRGYTPHCNVCEDAASQGGLPYINHDNCNSPGSVGHGRRGHCTADGCY